MGRWSGRNAPVTHSAPRPPRRCARQTAMLERLLATAFASAPKNRPLLLKDLIASPEVLTAVGPTAVAVLTVAFGSPLGLNLRNLLWHGFTVSEGSQLPETMTLFVGLVLASVATRIELNVEDVHPGVAGAKQAVGVRARRPPNVDTGLGDLAVQQSSVERLAVEQRVVRPSSPRPLHPTPSRRPVAPVPHAPAPLLEAGLLSGTGLDRGVRSMIGRCFAIPPGAAKVFHRAAAQYFACIAAHTASRDEAPAGSADGSLASSTMPHITAAAMVPTHGEAVSEGAVAFLTWTLMLTVIDHVECLMHFSARFRPTTGRVAVLSLECPCVPHAEWHV